LDFVVANSANTRAVGANAALAIDRLPTIGAVFAQATHSAAVDVAFILIQHAVVTAGLRAQVRSAATALTIGGGFTAVALLTQLAAGAASAVDVALVLVEHSIATGGCLANPSDAGQRHTILGGSAGLAQIAGRALTTAIYVALALVQLLVGAAGLPTLAIATRCTLAIVIHLAVLAVGTGRAVRTTAVNVGFFPVQGGVVTGRFVGPRIGSCVGLRAQPMKVRRIAAQRQ
jgi:hypothetical protein